MIDRRCRHEVSKACHADVGTEKNGIPGRVAAHGVPYAREAEHSLEDGNVGEQSDRIRHRGT